MKKNITFVKIIKQMVPVPIIRLYRKVTRMYQRSTYQGKSIKEVFTRIYQENEWGGSTGQYCSGSGSTEDYATIYANVVKKFVYENKVATIVDLGCGDFVVGSSLQMDGVKYIGVDIVEELVRRNQERYGGLDVSFRCLNIISDELPDGDLCLIRQVLQHLSNSQISVILQRIRKYRYVMITEHYPAPSVKGIPNLDKPHGPDTRIYDNSAVFLDQPPFNIPNSTKVLEVDLQAFLANKGEKLMTFLIKS